MEVRWAAFREVVMAILAIALREWVSGGRHGLSHPALLARGCVLAGNVNCWG